MRLPINRNFVFCAIAPLVLGGCVVAGQPGPQTYVQPYPAPPFQPQCQQTPSNNPALGPTISCTRPDGSVTTTTAPPPPSPSPPPRADQGYANAPYPPPPPPGYYGGNSNGY